MDAAAVHKFYVSSDIHFYTVADLVEKTTWSEATVHKLFNAPDFPSVDYGKNKVVEAHALIEYFSRKRKKEDDAYWRIN